MGSWLVSPACRKGCLDRHQQLRLTKRNPGEIPEVFNPFG
ncbi:hypothetical protein SynA1840_01211 [Synechococcus sp. A18-40]|nr:hypothetical protein SynA1840_01211 [Synechococcus sp. A18-40]